MYILKDVYTNKLPPICYWVSSKGNRLNRMPTRHSALSQAVGIHGPFSGSLNASWEGKINGRGKGGYLSKTYVMSQKNGAGQESFRRGEERAHSKLRHLQRGGGGVWARGKEKYGNRGTERKQSRLHSKVWQQDSMMHICKTANNQVWLKLGYTCRRLSWRLPEKEWVFLGCLV